MKKTKKCSIDNQRENMGILENQRDPTFKQYKF